jgi:pimeloyl-ACP methyl ester carboxylesterase
VRHVAAAIDHTFELPDGRRLGFAEFGDPSGRPVLSCHGGLVCRLDVAGADDVARRLGVRLVSPDRPGVGRSTRSADRTIAGWVADAVALLEHLGLERVGVLGWSMGGPYALALGARCPERVTRVCIVAGAVPAGWASASTFENPTDVALGALSRHAPWLGATAVKVSGEAAARLPRQWWRVARRSFAPRDVEVVERDGLDTFVRAAAEGMRRPYGVVDDYVAYARPWGFRPEDVEVPVRLWQGGADTFIPPACSREAAQRVPHASLTEVEGAGHLVAWDHWEAILSELASD